MSNSFSYEFTCCFSCCMDYFFGICFLSLWSCNCSSIQQKFSICVKWISHNWQKSIYFNIISCSWFCRILYYLCLLDPWPLPEGCYKVGLVFLSFHLSYPSFCLSLHFLKIGSLVFLLNLSPCDRVGFFGKHPHPAKMNKIGQKWPKSRVFGPFKKIRSSILSGICLKRKFLWFINIQQKLHAWKKSGSQVITKNGSWPMRFQYSLIVNISLID